MKKNQHRIVLLLMLAITLVMTSCSSAPDYTESEATTNGYALLNPSEGEDREVEIRIVQGSSYEYIFNGVVKDKKMFTSLTVLRKGLKSYYPNLFVIDGDTLLVNINSAMTATEDQVEFLFSDSKTLQGKYLEVPNGRVILNEVIQALQQAGLNELVAMRSLQEANGKKYDIDRVYTNEVTKNTLATIETKVDTNKQALIDKINEHCTTWASNQNDTFKSVLMYLNDCYDINDQKVKEDYPSLGEHVISNVLKEIKTLSTLAQEEDVHLEEGIEWSSKAKAFTHKLTLWKGDGIVGSICVSTSDGTEEDVSKFDISQKINAEVFLPELLKNVKNSCGIGYETSDFPYTSSYTSNTLTLTDSNDLYTAEHIFTMAGGSVVDYVVTINTYEPYIHIALQKKYEEMGYTCQGNDSTALDAGTGAGRLAYHTYSISKQYDCDNPISLLSIMQQIGVPGDATN